jgi:hypothetical protein
MMSQAQFEVHLDVRADLDKQPWVEAESIAHFGRIVGAGLVPGEDGPWLAVLIHTNEGATVIAGTTVRLAREAVRHLASVVNGDPAA